MRSKLFKVKHKVWYFFLQPASVIPLVFLRIAFAIFVLTLCFFLCPYVYDLYGNEGYMQWVISDHIFKKEFIPNLHSLYDWANYLRPVTDREVIKGAFLLYGVCLAFIGVGFFSNLFALLAWFLHLVFLNTGSIYGYGVETFIHIVLFYLIFMPVDAAFSLTAIIKKKKFRNEKFHLHLRVLARIFLRLLQLHLCIIYGNAGIAKLMGTQWYNGEAVWRSLTQFPFNTFNFSFTSAYPFLLKFAGWLVLVLEVLYPVFIWSYKTRKIWLGGIILMHVCIAVFMGLYFFSAIMIIINIAAFGFTKSLVSKTSTVYNNIGSVAKI